MQLLMLHALTIGLCYAGTIPSERPLQNGDSLSSGENESMHKPHVRSLPPQMAILDQKRQPKPKRPIGNDIGIARELNTTKRRYPTIPDHMETTISVGYTMTTSNATRPPNDDESAQVSRELHELIDAIPTMPSMFVPNLEMQKDPEEEDLNRRITQVARQLTETHIRKEYEEKINASSTITPPTTKAEKTAKSFIVASRLPLVSQLPQENAQLQLIAELPTIPHYLLDEGFQPRTPAPELIGPLLGGPPLKPENAEDERSGKSITTPQFMPLGFNDFIKLIAPKYELDPNDVVISIPVGSGFPLSLLGSQPKTV